jgi:hypothetical protein
MNWLPLVLTSVVTVAASSGFWTYLQARQNKKDPITRLLLGLAYDKIASLGMSYIERGWISRDEYEEYRKYLYGPYKDCGGNGVADRIMEDVSHLPLRSYGRYSRREGPEADNERRSTQDPSSQRQGV